MISQHNLTPFFQDMESANFLLDAAGVDTMFPSISSEPKSVKIIKKAIAEYLTMLTIHLMEEFNNGTFDRSLLKHKTGTFHSNSSIYGQNVVRMSPEERMMSILRLVSRCPNRQAMATNVSSIIDERAGQTTIYATSALSGHFDDFHRERVSEIKWVRKNGVWAAKQHTVLKAGGQPVARDYFALDGIAEPAWTTMMLGNESQ